MGAMIWQAPFQCFLNCTIERLQLSITSCLNDCLVSSLFMFLIFGTVLIVQWNARILTTVVVRLKCSVGEGFSRITICLMIFFRLLFSHYFGNSPIGWESFLGVWEEREGWLNFLRRVEKYDAYQHAGSWSAALSGAKKKSRHINLCRDSKKFTELKFFGLFPL